jgi:hypothetical protein
MKKYRVCGTTTVAVYKEVWANNEDEAYDKAWSKLTGLTAFCGNGGTDKLVGVYDSDASVAADDNIEYDDIEVLEDDPNYFECDECGEECEKKVDNDGIEYWWCSECCKGFDEDGYEYWPEEEEEE